MHGKIMLLSHNLTMRESEGESLVNSAQQFRTRKRGRQMDGRRTHRRRNAQKNDVALSHPYHKGKSCSKFG